MSKPGDQAVQPARLEMNGVANQARSQGADAAAWRGHNGHCSGAGGHGQCSPDDGWLDVCAIQVPRRLNDGLVVDPDVMAAIGTIIGVWFGGFTAGECEGEWEGMAEPSRRIAIAVPPGRVPEVREFACVIGRRLRQEAVYFEHCGRAEIIRLFDRSGDGRRERQRGR